MPKQENEEVVLKCDDCGEFMHIKIISMPKEHNGKMVKMFTKRTFCPNCQNDDLIFNHFKKQHEKEKKQRAQI